MFFGREVVKPDLPLPGWEATSRHSRAGVGEREESAAGWKSPSRLWEVFFFFLNRSLTAKKEAAAWVRRAGQRDTSANVGVVWASMRVKLAASLRHRPAFFDA